MFSMFKYFKKCLIRYLHPTDHPAPTIRIFNKMLEEELGFKDIKFPVKFRNIYKIEKNNSLSVTVFGYENKEKYPLCASKILSKNMFICCYKKKETKSTMFL